MDHIHTIAFEPAPVVLGALEAFVGYDDRLLDGARRLGCKPYSPR